MARVVALDSLRGVAAATVLFDHYALIFPLRLIPPKQPWAGGSWTDPWWWIDYSPLKLLFDGDQAVLVFFALSGFVLALSLKGASGSNYWHYLIKRVVRLYVPFAAAILFAAGLYLLAEPRVIPALSYYFNYTCWNQPPTVRILLGHLAMTDRREFGQLDHVMWSLVQEMRISFVFPLVVYFARARWLATIIVSVIISGLALTVYHFIRPDLLFNPFRTLMYLFLFATGAVLALKIDTATKLFASFPRRIRLALWSLTLAIVTYYPANNHFGLFVCGSAAIMLVALCYVDSGARNYLSLPPAVWLGKISFSLYLVHVPVILFVIHMLYGLLPLSILIGLSTMITFAASELGYRFVERPAMLTGRSLANRLAGGRVSVPASIS